MNPIYTRVSIRKYQDRSVEKEKTMAILRAAMQAPSAANQQPWEFFVVTNRAKLAALSEVSPYAGMTKNAPISVWLPGRGETAGGPVRREPHSFCGITCRLEVLDNDGNMILTEGLVLQDEKIWKSFLDRDIVPKSNSCELYFEEQDIESFVEKLERLYPAVEYVNHLMTHSWGQRVVRFYDLDGNLIEVGTPM